MLWLREGDSPAPGARQPPLPSTRLPLPKWEKRSRSNLSSWGAVFSGEGEEGCRFCICPCVHSETVMESAVPGLTLTPVSRRPSPLCNHRSSSLSLWGCGAQKVLKWKGHPIIQVGSRGCLLERGLWRESGGKDFKGSLGFGSFHSKSYCRTVYDLMFCAIYRESKRCSWWQGKKERRGKFWIEHN